MNGIAFMENRSLMRFGGLFLLLASILFAVCPAHATINLGAASNYAVFELDNNLFKLSNVTVNGDVAVGAGGTVNVVAPSVIDGDVYKDSTASVTNAGTITGAIYTQNMSQAVTDAINASNAAKALAATQTFSKITANKTITGNGGQNVIQVAGLDLNNENLTLSGGANDKFYINITGDLIMDGTAKIILTGGVTSDNVLLNFTKTGAKLTTKKMGNVINGIVLAPDSVISFYGTFNGRVIAGGGTMTFLSGAVVNGPSNTPIPEVSTFLPLGVLFAGAAGAEAVRRKRKALLASA